MKVVLVYYLTGTHISQLICYARACSQSNDFNRTEQNMRHLCITQTNIYALKGDSYCKV